MTQEYLLAIQDFDELKLAVRQVNCIDQLSLSLSLTVNIDLLQCTGNSKHILKSHKC